MIRLAALVVVAVTVPAVTMSAAPARATGTPTPYKGPDNSWVLPVSTVSSLGGSSSGRSGGSSSSGGGGSSQCTYYSFAQAAQALPGFSGQAPTAPKGDIYLLQYCPADNYVSATTSYGLKLVLAAKGGQVAGLAQVSPQTLAERASKTLSPPELQIGTAPCAGYAATRTQRPARLRADCRASKLQRNRASGLVGLPEWFWIQPGSYHAIEATAAVPGVSVTVKAKPGPLVINPGDGQPSFDCPGPGTVYNPSKPASVQQSDCTHVYDMPSASQPGKTFRVSVSVTWTATWKGTPAGGGTLPSITTEATIALPIRNAEGVYSGGSS